jgi:hypothetical protein
MAPRLTFTVNCGTLGSPELSRVMDLLACNPFGTYVELLNDGDDADGEPRPYCAQALLDIVQARAQWNVTLVDRREGRCTSVDLVQRTRGATFSVTVENERLSAEYERFWDHARSWLAALPNVSSGHVFDSACDLATLHRQQGLERPPACFTTHLRWIHILAPSYYTLFLTTEALLATPACRVEQDARDLVMIRNYPDPFSGAEPATLRQLAAITEHLRARDHFMQTLA